MVGSTNGTVTSARTTARPRNRYRESTNAPGMPIARVSAVERAACQIVNHTTWRR